MRDLRIPRMWLLVLMLSGPCLAADLFSSEAQRQAFLRALAKEDANYDPAQQMLRAEFSSPGYHTTLEGGIVHRTRESLEYAVALLDSGEPDRLKRAEADPGPRDRRCRTRTPTARPTASGRGSSKSRSTRCRRRTGTGRISAACSSCRSPSTTWTACPPTLQQKVHDSILHAARSIQRRDVGPGYTNIALMGTYVTLVAGERLDVRRAARLRPPAAACGSTTTPRRRARSPSTTARRTRCVAIEEISRMRRHVRDEESQDVLERLNDLRLASRRPAVPSADEAMGRPAQPLLLDAAASRRPWPFIQRAIDAGEARIPAGSRGLGEPGRPPARSALPAEPGRRLRTLLAPRTEIEAFVRNARDEHDIIGTTYLHPDFTLGSVNIGDLWNQRRPLIAYWQTPTGPAAVRLRCLHDDYDYASASIFTRPGPGRRARRGPVRHRPGRHPHLARQDRQRDDPGPGPAAASAVRGSGRRISHSPDKLASMSRSVSPRARSRACSAFTPRSSTICPCVWRPAGNRAEAWIDLVLYHGPERPFDFSRIEEASIVFTLSIAPKGSSSAVCGSLRLREHRRRTHRPRNRFASAGMVVPETQQPDVVSDHSHETAADAAAERGLLREDRRPGPVEILTSGGIERL